MVYGFCTDGLGEVSGYLEGGPLPVVWLLGGNCQILHVILGYFWVECVDFDQGSQEFLWFFKLHIDTFFTHFYDYFSWFCLLGEHWIEGRCLFLVNSRGIGVVLRFFCPKKVMLISCVIFPGGGCLFGYRSRCKLYFHESFTYVIKGVSKLSCLDLSWIRGTIFLDVF